jgi:hypothetical protein
MILLPEPVGDILSVVRKAKFSGVIRFFLDFELNIFGLKMPFMFGRVKSNRIARKGFAEYQ